MSGRNNIQDDGSPCSDVLISICRSFVSMGELGAKMTNMNESVSSTVAIAAALPSASAGGAATTSLLPTYV